MSITGQSPQEKTSCMKVTVLFYFCRIITNVWWFNCSQDQYINVCTVHSVLYCTCCQLASRSCPGPAPFSASPRSFSAHCTLDKLFQPVSDDSGVADVHSQGRRCCSSRCCAGARDPEAGSLDGRTHELYGEGRWRCTASSQLDSNGGKKVYSLPCSARASADTFMSTVLHCPCPPGLRLGGGELGHSIRPRRLLARLV